MTTRCHNCKRPIINPVDHEYCTYMAKPLPRIKHKSSKLSVGARIRKSVGPIVKRDGYVAPKVQGKLNHQIAKPGSRPPWYKAKTGSYDGENSNGTLDNYVGVIED